VNGVADQVPNTLPTPAFRAAIAFAFRRSLGPLWVEIVWKRLWQAPLATDFWLTIIASGEDSSLVNAGSILLLDYAFMNSISGCTPRMLIARFML